MYQIKAAAFILPSPYCKRFVHGFWVLARAEDSQIIAELHGLPTSRSTLQIVPIGYKKEHSLRGYHFIRCPSFAEKYAADVSQFCLPHDKSQVIYEGSQALEKWDLAVNAIERVNQLDLNYPFGGLSIFKKSAANSNTLYRFLGEVMQINTYRFPRYFYPGFTHILVA